MEQFHLTIKEVLVQIIHPNFWMIIIRQIIFFKDKILYLQVKGLPLIYQGIHTQILNK